MKVVEVFRIVLVCIMVDIDVLIIGNKKVTNVNGWKVLGKVFLEIVVGVNNLIGVVLSIAMYFVIYIYDYIIGVVVQDEDY